jgi:DNA repair exonuclease SbcCD ATPase subunit
MLNKDNQKLVSITVENFKNIDRIVIRDELDKDVVYICGENRAGKTALIDAIGCTLGGHKIEKYLELVEPVKKGAKKAVTIVELTDYIIQKTWRKGRSPELEVLAKAGDSNVKVMSPQKFLDDFISLFIDPMIFREMSEDKRTDMILEHIGLKKKLNDIKIHYDSLYMERREVNREADKLKKTLDSEDKPEANLPDEELSVTNLVQSLQDANDTIRENAEIKNSYHTKLAQFKDAVKVLEELKKGVTKQEEYVNKLQQEGKTLEEKYKNLYTPDVEYIQILINTAEDSNKKIRYAKKYSQMENALGDLVIKADDMTHKLGKIKNEKIELLKEAKWPVEGLGLDDEGRLTYNGNVFSMLSDEEKDTVCAHIAISEGERANKLKILLIKRGGVYTEKSLQSLISAVQPKGYLTFVEIPGVRKDALLIENGSVAK